MGAALPGATPNSTPNAGTGAKRLVVATFYALALPLILLDYDSGRAFFDQLHFHLPTIQGFIHQLDFGDYRSATTPGYHALLAIVGKLGIDSSVGLKLTNSLFTAALLAMMAHFLAPAFGKGKTWLLLLPVMLSIYIFPAGIWLIPDNLAWLSVGAMILVVTRLPFSRMRNLAGGLILLCAMLVRQSNLWLAAVIWAATLAYGLDQRHSPGRRLSALIQSFIVCLPAFITFYLFYKLWGGFVPPSFQQIHQHFSFSVPAFFLSVFAFYGVFYLPIFMPALKVVERQTLFGWSIAGGLIGFGLALFPATDFDRSLGRFSGLWNLVKATPVIGETSLIIVLLSTAGGVLMAALLTLFKRELRLVITLSTLAFILSQLVNKFVYERYFAGFVFILLVVFLRQSMKVLGKHQSSLPHTPWIWTGTWLFALFNLAVLVRGLS